MDPAPRERRNHGMRIRVTRPARAGQPNRKRHGRAVERAGKAAFTRITLAASARCRRTAVRKRAPACTLAGERPGSRPSDVTKGRRCPTAPPGRETQNASETAGPAFALAESSQECRRVSHTAPGRTTRCFPGSDRYPTAGHPRRGRWRKLNRTWSGQDTPEPSQSSRFPELRLADPADADAAGSAAVMSVQATRSKRLSMEMGRN